MFWNYERGIQSWPTIFRLREELEPPSKDIASVKFKSPIPRRNTVSQRNEAAKNLEDLINNIRKLPEFRGFLLPPRKHGREIWEAPECSSGYGILP